MLTLYWDMQSRAARPATKDGLTNTLTNPPTWYDAATNRIGFCDYVAQSAMDTLSRLFSKVRVFAGRIREKALARTCPLSQPDFPNAC